MKPTGLNPYVFVENADAAIEWYRDHLGAVEYLRAASPDGVVVQCILFYGDCVLMLSEAAGEWSTAPGTEGPSSANLMLYVENVDATQAVYVANGATELMPVGDKFWGERMGKIRDPFGHVRNLATVTETLTAEEIVARAKVALGG